MACSDGLQEQALAAAASWGCADGANRPVSDTQQNIVQNPHTQKVPIDQLMHPACPPPQVLCTAQHTYMLTVKAINLLTPLR